MAFYAEPTAVTGPPGAGDTMLDDSDRRAFDEITRDLTRPPAEVPRFPLVSALCVALFVSLPMVKLLFGWGMAGAWVGVFALAVAAVLVHRIRSGPPGTWRRRSTPR
jgi:hypothetical protein